MPERIKIDHIFGYNTLMKEGSDIIGLAGEEVPELHKGTKVEMVGDTKGYIRSGHRPGEEATIVEFREPDKNGSTDYIIKVSNATREGWVKPSNIRIPRKFSISVEDVRE